MAQEEPTHELSPETERRILRKLVSGFLRRGEGRLADPNDFRRQMHRVAKDLGETSEDLLTVLEPLWTTVVSEMFAEAKKPVEPK